MLRSRAALRLEAGRRLCRPGCRKSKRAVADADDGWPPEGSLAAYDPRDFAELFTVMATLHLRAAVAATLALLLGGS